MRIITLLARHGTAQYGDAVSAIDDFFGRRMPGVVRDLLVIDNALPEDHAATLGPGRALIGGPNSHWEFSAWDRGVSYLGARLDGYDWVHLATSAFRALGTDHLARFDGGLLGLMQDRKSAIGHIDHYDDSVIIRGHSLCSWLRSSFVFVRASEVRGLGSLISIPDPRPFFSGDPASPFRADAPLSANYRQYLLSWLTGRGTGQGVQWHSRFDLSPETLGRFEAKAAAILNEQLLSSRLSAQGCSLVDVTWLAAQRARMRPDQPLGPIPDWKRQIASRSRPS
jgi:hypothetical protein